MYILVNWINQNEYEIMDVSKPTFKKNKNYFKTFLKYSPYFFNLIPAFSFFKNLFYK